MKHPLIEPLEQRIAPAAVNPTAISITDAEISPNPGGGSSTVVFYLTLDHPVPAGEQVLVHYHTVDGTAISTGVAPDFVPAADTTLSFAAGDLTKAISVQVNSTGAYGPNEKFEVLLTGAALDDSQGNPIKDGQGDPIVLTENPGTASGVAGAGTGTIHYSNPLPTVSILAAPEVAEGNASHFTVMLSAAQDYDVTVHYSTVDGTATAGTDFTGATSQTFTIPKGQISASIAVPTVNHLGAGSDTGSGPDQTFSLHLEDSNLGTPASDPLTITSSTAQGLIKDVGPGHIALVGDNNGTTLTVNESAGTATFTVKRLDNFASAASVDYSTANGTATNGTDYTAVSGTINFAPGETIKSISVPILHAHKYTGSETFTVQLANAQGVTIPAGQETGTITILDNDPVVSHFSVGGSNSGNTVNVDESAGTVKVFVNRTGDLSGSATVHYATAPGTAIDGTDYSGDSGTLNFADGQGQAVINIPILDRHLSGGSEAFTVQLSQPTGADIAANQGTATVTINNNDTFPSHFSLGGAVSVNESAGTVTLVVNRTGDLTGSAAVDFSTVAGTAVAGTDYTALNTTINFGPGVGQKLITVPILDPHKTIGTVQFNAQLSNAANADITAGQGAATVTINDNDPAASHFAIVGDTVNNASTTGATVNETAGTVTFTVKRTGDTTGSASVVYQTLDGSARNGVDYTGNAPTTLSFAAGETEKTITIPIVDAGKTSGTSQFTVKLSTPEFADFSTDPATHFALDTGTVTIQDQDAAPSHFSLLGDGNTTTATVDDKTGTVTLTIKRTGDTSGAASVSYATADGTATHGVNYTSVSGTVDFAAGVTEQTIAIPVIGTPYAGNQQFSVFLSDPRHADITSGQGTDTVIIAGTNHFAISSTEVNEGNGTVTLHVTRTGSDLSTSSATVNYKTVDGTAVQGTDYTAIPLTELDFAPGDTSKDITVSLRDAHKFGIDETFSVQLSDSVNADISAGKDIGTVTIHEADASGTHLAISGPSGNINETAGTVSFTITRSGVTTGSSSVSYTTLDGTAIHGVDYTSTTGTVNFAAGETQKTITVPLINFNHHDPSQFSVQLMTAHNADIVAGSGTATANVVDDATLTISVSDATVLKSSTGTTHEVFTVTLSAMDRTHDVTVKYNTLDGTAISVIDPNNPNRPIDYTAATGTITFLAGTTTLSQTISIDVPANAVIPSGTESFTLQLHDPSSDATLAKATGTGKITNNFTETISVDSPSAPEGSDETFTVSLSNPSSTPVTVHYKTADGTAHAGTDYAAVGDTVVTFQPYETSKTFTVHTTDTGLAGPSKNFTVLLSTPSSGAIISTSSSTSTIQNIHDPIVTINDVQIQEGSDPANPNFAVFTVTLSHAIGANDKPLTFDYKTVDGTGLTGATSTGSGADFVSTTGTLIFGPGETVKTITVPINGDSVKEGNDQFTVKLTDKSETSGSSTFSSDTGHGTILNDDTSIGITVSDATVTEGSGGAVKFANFTVTLSGPSSTPIILKYATNDGTATSSGVAPDFTAQALTSITFAPGETQKTIAIPINGDNAKEVDEQFTLVVSGDTATSGPPAGTVFVDAGNTHPLTLTGTGTIHDDDTVIGVNIGDATVAEDVAGGMATFTVTLSAASSAPVTVNYATVDGTAISSGALPDFSAVSGALTFAAGETVKTISIPIHDDGFKEAAQEQFTVKLSLPSDATVALANDTGHGTITDNDSTGLIGVRINDVQVTEGKAGDGKTATFTITLSAASDTAITLNYATFDGTATSLGSTADFQAVAKTPITFAPGETSKTISVPINGDSAKEADEQFTVKLTGATNVSGPPAGTQFVDAGGTAPSSLSGTATILNDDTQVGVSIDSGSFSEGAGAAVFTVHLSQASNVPVTVTYQTVDGTATSVGSHPDFRGTSGTITFQPGQTDLTIDDPLHSIAINDDTIKEANETFQIQLSGAHNAVLDASSSIGTITIVDNDTSVVGLTVSDGQAAEGDSGAANHVDFTVSLTAPSATDVTFVYTPHLLAGFGDQSAKAGEFSTQSGQITIPAGQTSATISVPIQGNTVFQADRSFALDLSQVSSNAVPLKSSAIGTIMDDDTQLVHNVLKWHDIDGDIVTMKISKGHIADAGISFSATKDPTTGGVILQTLDLSSRGGEFAHANVTITAEPAKIFSNGQVIGDGHVNVGYIVGNTDPTNILTSTHPVDLGVVTVDGDLARIDAGDIFNDAGLAGLNVLSLGAHAETLPANLNSNTVSTIVGPVLNLHVVNDFIGQMQVIGQEFGFINHVNIGGVLKGGLFFSGNLSSAIIGTIDGSGNGSTGVLESLSGTNGSIGSLTVLGGVIGGSTQQSGVVLVNHIGKVDVGSIVAGSGANSGSVEANFGISNVTVRGSVIGTNAANTFNVNGTLGSLSSGAIVSFGTIGSVHVMGDLIGGPAQRAGSISALGAGGLGSVAIDGSLRGGTGANSGEIESQGSIGTVKIAGSILGAGGLNSGSVAANGGGIGTVKVGGSMNGSSGQDSGSIDALSGSIGSLSLAGHLQGGQGVRSGSIRSAGQIGTLAIGPIPGSGGPTAFDAIIGAVGVDSGWISAHGIGKAIIHGNINGSTGQDSGSIDASGGPTGSLVVQGHLQGDAGLRSGSIHSTGKVGSVEIGTIPLTGIATAFDALIGRSGVDSGWVSALDLGSVLVHGNVKGGTGNFSGGVQTTDAIGKIEIQGNLLGGDSVAVHPTGGGAGTRDTGFISAGSIASVIIDGSLTAGADKGGGLSGSGLVNASGAINSIWIKQGFGGVAGGAHATIAVGGTTSGIALKRVQIDGAISGGDIIAGSSTDQALIPSESPDAQIGTVLINGTTVAGLHIAAGADAGADLKLFTGDDVLISNPNHDSAGILSRIASVIFSRASGAAITDSTIEAQEVDSVAVTGQSTVKNPGVFPGVNVGGAGSSLVAFAIAPAS